jgi:hypothetical protein
MMRWLSRLSTNQRLALVAFMLGLVAVFARPTQGGSVTLSPQELAVIVQKEVDHVRPLELADWIIKGRVDYRLIDLRDEQAFAAYHIPGAENIQLAALPSSDLARNEKVVLYSDGGIHAAQAWFLLRAKGFRAVYMLFGGLDGWKEEVLFPTIAADAPASQPADIAKVRAVCAYFGGTPNGGPAGQVAAGGAAMPTMSAAMPKLTMPSGNKPAPKKKKEGC